jgi:hypothetical protein
LVSPARQATTFASPDCTARAARRSATTPLAPPSGMWSSQRGAMPRCCVRPMAVSGCKVKLEMVSPSISCFFRFEFFSSRSRHRASHQCAERIE